MIAWRERNEKMKPEIDITADNLWSGLINKHPYRGFDRQTPPEMQHVLPFARDKVAMKRLEWAVNNTTKEEQQWIVKLVLDPQRSSMDPLDIDIRSDRLVVCFLLGNATHDQVLQRDRDALPKRFGDQPLGIVVGSMKRPLDASRRI